MLKKAALAVFAMLLAINVTAPPKAAAQVHVGVGVSVGLPGVVVEQPAPVVVVQPPPPVVVYDEAFFVGHPWTYGFHDGYYYDNGARYWVDEHRHRHYDDRYRMERVSWVHRHHDNGWHGERGPGHDNGWHNGDRHEHGGGRDGGHHDHGWHHEGNHDHGHGDH